MSPQSLFVLRARLARRLSLIALAGLSCIGLLALLMLLLAALAGQGAWEAIQAGQPLSSVLSSVLSVLGGLLGLALLNLLWVTPGAQQGVLLSAEGAEALHALLDELGAALKLPRIRKIYITEQMNAQIRQESRFGLDCSRATLMIGLPLAHNLSPERFRAVIAHELAHLAAQRRGVAAVGCALRAWSMRVLERMSAELSLLAPWLDRLSYRFCVDLLRLARIEEYEADWIAAELVGKVAVGEALLETSLKANFLDRDFWPSVEAVNAGCQQPDILPFRFMGLGLEASFMRTVAEHAVALEACVDEPALFHPSLRQRLSLLGVPQRVPVGSERSAAECYLAPLLPALANSFDQAWSRSWQYGRQE